MEEKKGSDSFTLAATDDRNKAQDQEVLITRVFNAPRAVVFKAWAQPGHLEKWYAPKNCSIRIHSMDFRIGGAFHHTIKTPTGYTCTCKGVYHAIREPELIMYSLCFADAKGNIISPAAAGADPDWPHETTVTVTFTEHEGKTTLRLQQTVSSALAQRTGAYPSWLEMLDLLDETIQPQSA